MYTCITHYSQSVALHTYDMENYTLYIHVQVITSLDLCIVEAIYNCANSSFYYQFHWSRWCSLLVHRKHIHDSYQFSIRIGLTAHLVRFLSLSSHAQSSLLHLPISNHVVYASEYIHLAPCCINVHSVCVHYSYCVS